MDPNISLAEARNAVTDFNTAPLRHTQDIAVPTEAETIAVAEAVLDAAQSLINAFEALDGWLSGGGFPPDAWGPSEAVLQDRALAALREASLVDVDTVYDIQDQGRDAVDVAGLVVRRVLGRS